MFGSSWRDELGPLVVKEQIVVGAAIIAGAVPILVMAAVLVHYGGLDMGENETLAQIMNLVLVAFLTAAIIASAVVPTLMVSRARRKIAAGDWNVSQGPYQPKVAEMIERTGDAGKLIGVHCTKTIISVAIIEGLTFFAIIVYLVVQSTFAVCVAIAMIAVLALHFPTRNSVMDWIENQLHRIREQQFFG